MKSTYFSKKNENHNEHNMNAFNKFIEMNTDFNKIDEIRNFLNEFNNKYHKTTGFKISLNFETIEEEITENLDDDTEIINHCLLQTQYLNEITENLDDDTEIINEIKQEYLQEINDEFDENFDEDMKGEVESIILEIVDRIELQEEVITETTEEVIEEVITEPPVIINYHCATCNYTGKDNYGLRRHMTSKKHLKNFNGFNP